MSPNTANAIRLRAGILAFSVIAAVITMYPPFEWGAGDLGAPFKSYAFLFGPGSAQLAQPVLDGQARGEFGPPTTYQRKLLVGELLLEYALAALLASIVALMWPSRHSSTVNNLLPPKT